MGYNGLARKLTIPLMKKSEEEISHAGESVRIKTTNLKGEWDRSYVTDGNMTQCRTADGQKVNSRTTLGHSMELNSSYFTQQSQLLTHSLRLNRSTRHRGGTSERRTGLTCTRAGSKEPSKARLKRGGRF